MFNSKPTIKTNTMQYINKHHENVKKFIMTITIHCYVYKQAEQPTVRLSDFKSARSDTYYL